MKMSHSERIVVAMSGGVDSSAVAALLKRRGYQVIGIGLKLSEPPLPSQGIPTCCGIAGMNDARRVASQIGIPFYVLDYEEIFETAVIDKFCRSYLNGLTPNPCVECNRAVKFGRLLELADVLGADHVATGHYARVCRDPRTGRYLLKKGTDAEKDQSYFLYALSQDQLSRALFPLGAMTKDDTRRLARSFGLCVHDKPASQDVCFLGRTDYRRYLVERFPESLSPGRIVNARGQVLGRHQGIAFYTVGQRRGLGVATGQPLYVVSVERATGTVVVGNRRTLQCSHVSVRHVNWIRFDEPPDAFQVGVKTRYRQPEAPATITPGRNGGAIASYLTPRPAAARGQSAVFYDGDVVVGGGIID